MFDDYTIVHIVIILCWRSNMYNMTCRLKLSRKSYMYKKGYRLPIQLNLYLIKRIYYTMCIHAYYVLSSIRRYIPNLD